MTTPTPCSPKTRSTRLPKCRFRTAALSGVGIIAAIGFTAPRGLAADGLFSSGAFFNDATTGVSTSKIYTTAANVIGGDVTVNGVTFTGSGGGTSGTGWALSGFGSQFPSGSGGNHTTTFAGQAITGLFDGFQYGGNPGVVTIGSAPSTSGELIVGQTYVATFYNEAWGLGANRTQTVTSSTGASIVYNEDALEASVLRYTFVATASTTALNFAPQIAGNTMHLYGLSNEQVFTGNTWTPTVDSSWNTAANWTTASAPNSVGSAATLSTQTSPTSITIDSPTTVGHIEFLGSGGYTVSGSSTLTLQADAGGASVLKTDAGTHTISAPLQLNTAVAKFGAGTLRLSGTIAGSGKGLTVGSGTVILESPSADISGVGPVANSGTLVINNAATQNLNTTISGTGGLEKNGAGLLTVGGNQTYTGPTNINAGTVKLNPTVALTITNGSFQTYDSLANGNFGYRPTGTGWDFTGFAGIGLNGSPWFNPTNHDGNAGAYIQNSGTSGTVSQTINVTTAGYYNFGFQAVGRAGVNGPNGLFFQVDGGTEKTFTAADFSQTSWANYVAGANLSVGTHVITFTGNNTLGGDRATVIDAVTANSANLLPSNTALSLTASGATLDLTGASQTVGSLAGAAGSSVINDGSFTAGGNNTSTSFAGNISGAGSFTKVGNGVLTLAGANTYAGSTSISAGTVRLSGGSLPSTTTLNLTTAGATFDLAGNAQTIASLTGAAGTTVDLGSGALTTGGNNASTTFAGTITGAGSLTKVGNGKLTLAGTNSYSGGTTISAGTLQTDTANTSGAGNFTVAAGATWDLGTASHSVSGLTGNGTIARSGVLTTGLDGSALISSSKNYVQKLDFGNNGGATVNGVAFDSVGTSGTDWSLTGAGTLFGGTDIGGYDQLINDFYYGGKPGVLTFSNLNVGQTYNAVVYTKVGSWVGCLQNATFDEDGTGPVSNQLLSTEPGNLGYYSYKFVAATSSASITMAPLNQNDTFHWFAASLENVTAAPATLTIGDSNNYDFGGAINGPTTLIKQGTGIQALFGASNFSGGTSINAGSIFAHHASALGTGTVNVASGANYIAWWNTGSSPVIANNFVLNGLGGNPSDGNKGAIYADGGGAGFSEYNITGSVQLNATSNVGGNNLNNLRLSGPVTGPGGLTKGAGRIDENGTLILANSTNSYAGDTVINQGTIKLGASQVVPDGSGKGKVVVNSGATFDLGGYHETINNLSGSGTVTSTPSASLGTPVVFADDSGTDISTAKTYTHALDFAESAAPAIVNGVTFTGAGLTGGNWSLTGAGGVAGNGGTLSTGGISTLLTNFYFGGNPAKLTLSGLTAGVTYETRLYERFWGGDRTQYFTIQSGGVSGVALFNEDFSSTQANYVPIRYTADASGSVTISTYVAGAGANPGSYHWYGLTNEVVAAPTAPTLTVGDATDSTFSGSITGSLAITKTGNGTLNLTGSNSYTAATTVSGGRLLVNGSLSGTSSVAVNGGTLGGSGSINPAAAITVAAGAKIAPGASIGTLSTGPVSFAAGSIFDAEVDSTTADQLAISGSAALNGAVALNLTLLADPTDNTLFNLINGTSPLSGGGVLSYLGNDLTEGEIFTVTTGAFTQDFQISYLADTGNDVTLLAVPEPGAAVSLLGGLGVLLGLRRRRK